MERIVAGLSNLGNTCYMNSILQCISATPNFVAYLLDNEYKEDLEYNVKHKMARKVREKLEDKDAPITLSAMDFDTECKSTITYQLHYLLKEMWTQQVEITPRTFKKIIGTKNELFSGYDQNDSQEFLGLLLNSVHDELKQEKKISINLPEYIQMINKRIEENQQLKSEYPNEYTYIESIKYLQKYSCTVLGFFYLPPFHQFFIEFIN